MNPLWGSLIVATVAVLGIVAALWREQLLRLFKGARFDVTYEHKEPYFQQSDAGKTQNHAVRFAVRNATKNLVKGVVFVLNDITGDGVPVPGFIPLRLTWTHRHITAGKDYVRSEPVLDALAPSQTAFVDFGLLKRNPSDQKPPTGPNGLRFDLYGEWDPATLGCRLLGGTKYRASFQIFGEDGIHAEGVVAFYFKAEEASDVHNGSMQLTVKT